MVASSTLILSQFKAPTLVILLSPRLKFPASEVIGRCSYCSPTDRITTDLVSSECNTLAKSTVASKSVFLPKTILSLELVVTNLRYELLPSVIFKASAKLSVNEILLVVVFPPKTISSHLRHQH